MRSEDQESRNQFRCRLFVADPFIPNPTTAPVLPQHIHLKPAKGGRIIGQSCDLNLGPQGLLLAVVNQRGIDRYALRPRCSRQQVFETTAQLRRFNQFNIVDVRIPAGNDGVTGSKI